MAPLYGGMRYLLKDQLISHTDDPRWWRLTNDFPPEVGVEVTNHCNIKCKMCPHVKGISLQGHMAWDLFEKIVLECARHRGFLFKPQGFGEFLLYPSWRECLELTRRHGIRPVVIITAGTLFTVRNIPYLGPDDIHTVAFSYDGISRAHYERHRKGADFDEVTENIRNYLSHRKGPYPPVVLQLIEMGDIREEEKEAFIRRWSGYLDRHDEILFSPFQNWLGRVDRTIGGRPPKPPISRSCRMLWRNLSIHWDGRVSTCCLDVDCELLIGDIRENTIREIWQGEPLRRLREAHIRGDLKKYPLCRHCRDYS
jgi:radical SAM protein with 4Fe4S-binding SPASM domain